MASFDGGQSSRTKDQRNRYAKSTNFDVDETFDENNANDSKSDSDKVLEGQGAAAGGGFSIYASQRQRRRDTFQQRVEEKRKTKVTVTTQSSACLYDRSAISMAPPPDIPPRPSSAAGGSVTSNDVVNMSVTNGNAPSISIADSGYLTRKEQAMLTKEEVLANSIKHGETIPPGRAAKTGIKSCLPVPELVRPPSVNRKSPIVSPSAESEEYFVINGHYYRILNQVGKGGSSKVFQVYDEERKLCLAIKRVDLSDADEMVVTAYLNEISLLKRLQKYPKRVIRMYDYEYLESEQRLYVVMEKGDTDLASFFKSRQAEKMPDQMIAFYWLEMLKAVEVIHQEGIVHSDLKPANFLLVAGDLKLIDFGIANAVPANRTSVTRECQMGTLNYMSPEALSCADANDSDDMKNRIGVKSDVWSLGCILYNMVYGKTPFQDIRNPMAKMNAVLSKKHIIPFPPIDDQSLINVMKRCLERNPKKRATIEELLEHSYSKSCGSGASSSVNVSNENLQSLTERIQKATPRTGARLIQAALSRMQGASSSDPVAKGMTF